MPALVQTSRGRRFVGVLSLATVMSAVPLGAQQAAPAAAKPQTAPPAQNGPTINLSMDQAVAMSLDTNLGLKSDRVNLAIASQNIAGARAAFKPTLTSNFTRNTATSQPQSFTESTAASVSSSSSSVGTRWQQAIPWFGGGYSVNWTGSRSATTSFTNFNPQLRSSITLGFQQPLWRNFTIDPSRAGLESAERGHEIADLNLQQQVLQTQDQVRNAYLNLKAAMAQLDVAMQNREIAQKALLNAQAKIVAGVAADIDEIQSQASLLQSEEGVIVNEAGRASAEDALRALILDPARPDYWTVHINPTDEMSSSPRPIDVDAAIKNAMANRLDLVVTRRSMDVTALNLRLAENQVRPSVDFSATYAASATGGTILNYDNNSPDFPPPLLSTSTKGFSSVLGDTFGGTYPSWTLGVQVGYPIGQSAAQVSLARTRLQQEQQAIDLHNLELQIAQQVRQAARQVESGYRRVESTQKALEANEKQYAAEQRKEAVGMSSTFEVLTKQQALFSARLTFLNAQILYNVALIAFDRVQKIR